MVARPNVMIKVPATLEGLPAIRRLIAEGINVNVTLIFGLERYRLVTEAFLAGLEDRMKAGLPLARIDSVASFFLSRIDVLIDPDAGKNGGRRRRAGRLAQSLVGEVALASAKQAYQMYQEIFAGPRWEALQAQGAETQRLLWASTGNKNPKYDDLKYVENLIGPKTVNTVPVETLDIFRERGQPAGRLEEGLDQLGEVLRRLPELGLDLEKLTNDLEVDGAKEIQRPLWQADGVGG
jgi:transaldolase/glucose-6-phosphate isomerase